MACKGINSTLLPRRSGYERRHVLVELDYEFERPSAKLHSAIRATIDIASYQNTKINQG